MLDRLIGITWDYEGNTFMREFVLTLPSPLSDSSIMDAVFAYCDENGISPWEIQIVR